LELIGVSGEAINDVVDPRRWVVRVKLLEAINDLLDQLPFPDGLAVGCAAAGEVISGLPGDGGITVDAALIVRPRMFPVERSAPRRLI